MTTDPTCGINKQHGAVAGGIVSLDQPDRNGNLVTLRDPTQPVADITGNDHCICQRTGVERAHIVSSRLFVRKHFIG